MDIKIRDIKPEDIESTTRLYHETWLATYPSEKYNITREDIDFRYKDSYTKERLEKAAQRIENLPANEKYLVVEIDGKIVGVSRVLRHADKNELKTIYVLPGFQGKGIGQRLWNEGKKFLNSKLPTIVHVAVYNEGAIAFYKKNGFRETGNLFTDERFRMRNGSLFPETELVLDPK